MDDDGPNFDVEDLRELLRQHGIDLVVFLRGNAHIRPYHFFERPEDVEIAVLHVLRMLVDHDEDDHTQILSETHDISSLVEYMRARNILPTDQTVHKHSDDLEEPSI